MKDIKTSPVLRHILLYIIVVGITAITIAAGVGRERQSVAEPKLRYSTKWPLKFARGKPVTTPILYCGTEGSGRGYYTMSGGTMSVTPYDAKADNHLCRLIPDYNYTSSAGIAIFSVVAVALFGLRWLRKSDKNAAKRFVVALVVLGARYYYFSQTDEPAGALFDKSDHALVIATLVWLFAWDAMVTVQTYIRQKDAMVTVLTLVVAMGIGLALLISLSVTAGVFHTADEMWAGWRDAVYFLVAAGLLAVLSEYSMALEAATYRELSQKIDSDPSNGKSAELEEWKSAELEEGSLVF
jgi:hypothetical protein